MTLSPETTRRRAITVELSGLPGGGVRARTPAKVNLWLVVRGRRADGFHEIDTLMVTLDLMDEIEVRPQPQETVDLEVTGEDVAGGDDNLCVRAAQAFLMAAGRRDGLHMRLHKRIPVGAGLGGGSGDAAGVLLALDRLLPGALPAGRLEEVAATLGSDVPFFLAGGLARCSGRGEVVEPWPVVADLDGILLYPDISISTRDVYAYSGKILPTAVNPDILPLNLIGHRVWAEPGSAGRVETRREGAPRDLDGSRDVEVAGLPADAAQGSPPSGSRGEIESGRVLPGPSEPYSTREGLAGVARGPGARASNPATSERGGQGDAVIAGASTAGRALQGVGDVREGSLAGPRLSASMPRGEHPREAGRFLVVLENHLEAAALAVCPELAAARARMEAVGLPRPLLCGSGSSLLSILDDSSRPRAPDLLEALRAAGFSRVFRVRSTAGNGQVNPTA